MARRDCNFNTALIALANMPLAVQYLKLFQFITLFHGHSIRGLSRRAPCFACYGINSGLC